MLKLRCNITWFCYRGIIAMILKYIRKMFINNEKAWDFESLRDFWVSDKLTNIKPGDFGEFPEGFDPRKILELLHRWIGGGQITELGCGYGRLCTAFPVDQYYGLDLNPFAIKKAKETFPPYQFDIIDEPNRLQGGIMLLAYTVFLHMPDDVLIEWINSAKKHYNYIVICEILGRDWRRTAGTTPVFNRELNEYVALLNPFNLITEIRIPYQRYVKIPFASKVKNTDISFMVFGRDEICLSGFALTEG